MGRLLLRANGAMKKSVLITDLDNTLFDWFSIWYHSFHAMLLKVEEISGISRDELIREIRPIHQKHGTSEYSFILEDLPSLQAMYGNRHSIIEALDEAIHAYRSARKKNMKLYPGVLTTMQRIRSIGAYIVAYTESQAYYSIYRIKKMELDGVIDMLFSPEDHDIPIKEEERTIVSLEKTIHKHTPSGELKPNPRLLLDIIDTIGARPEQCLYIGDSEIKDIEMAQRAGISDVLASYGATHFQENIEGYNLLRAVSHWKDTDVQREKKFKNEALGHKATYSVDNFSEILSLYDFVPFNRELRNG